MFVIVCLIMAKDAKKGSGKLEFLEWFGVFLEMCGVGENFYIGMSYTGFNAYVYEVFTI